MVEFGWLWQGTGTRIFAFGGQLSDREILVAVEVAQGRAWL